MKALIRPAIASCSLIWFFDLAMVITFYQAPSFYINHHQLLYSIFLILQLYCIMLTVYGIVKKLVTLPLVSFATFIFNALSIFGYILLVMLVG
ncbi:hypothetical protein [Streptococcus marmotae]|uniref:hypothetical protein n=1 Tax=Streptococcus marmotae TaxID=1825069 RepID=UPI0008328A3B|nr:hypothetical protein [Streptococcus marmotae]